MSELLPAIRKELKIINCHKQFIQVQNKTVIHLLQSLLNHQQQPHISYASRIEKSILKEANKNVFVLMKWYITLHEAIRKARNHYAIELILNLINSIKYLQPEKKYERYLIQKLVKPYRQYLNKLAELTCQRIRGSAEEEDQQKQMYVFCQYNLITFAGGQLSASAQEFLGFLTKYYPFLVSYLYLIGRDITVFYKHIKRAFAKHQISKLTHLQIQKLGHSIEIFCKHKADKFNSWVDIQTDADSQEASNKNKHSPQEIIQQASRGRNKTQDDFQGDWGMAISIIDKYEL